MDSDVLPGDLVVLYQPALDEIAHQLLHHALTDWPQGNAAQVVVAVHQEVDRQLGRLLEHLGHEDTLIISSDHGQTPITASVRPNILLRQAGLLAFKGDKVDLERTRALFLSNGWVVINTTQHRGGCVPLPAYTTTLQDVERCLQTPVRLPDGQALRLQCRRDLWQGTTPAPGDTFVWAPAAVELRPHFFGPVCGPPEVGGHPDVPTIVSISAGTPRRLWTGSDHHVIPHANSGVANLVRHALAL